MNILFIFNRPITAHSGGVERVTSILSRHFADKGHKAIYLCYSDKDFSEHNDDFEKEQLFLRPSDIEQPRHEKLKEIIVGYKIDAVIDQVMMIDLSRAIKKMYPSIPVIGVYHNQPFAYSGKERKLMENYYPTSVKGKIFRWAGILMPLITRLYYNRSYRKSFEEMVACYDRVCLLSEAFIPRVKAHMGDAVCGKLIVINNPNTFDSVVASNDTKKEQIILIVGRVYNLSKNMLDFLRMWRRLAPANPKWRAVVVGDGPDLGRLKQYASLHGVERIEFAGNQKDVSIYYERASIFCLTSIYEGWGMVLVEALGKGCVPVAYDSFEAVHDIIKDGINGFCVPKFDVGALTAKIQSLIDNPQVLKTMRLEGPQSIEQFGGDVIADKWIETIKEIKE